jgi:hypothetical protein
MKLCAQFARRTDQHWRSAVNLIDGEYGSAEFSDLYLRILSAALDETNSSLSPQLKESNLNAHVARGISMADMAPPSIRRRG